MSDPTTPPTDPTPEGASNGTGAPPEAETLRLRAEAAERDRDQYLALLQRTKADFENWQKRSQRDREAERQYAHQGLAADLLPRLARCPGWEVLLLHPAEQEPGACSARGFAACHASGDLYAPAFIGMDYAFVESHGLYRQLLAHVLQRAEEVGARQLAFGLGSELEKRRFGARPTPRAVFVQSHDRYHHDLLELIASSTHLEAEGSLPPTGR